MLTVFGALGVIALVTIIITRIATGPITWIWTKAKPLSGLVPEEDKRDEEPLPHLYYFQFAWGQRPLPIHGTVAIIDHGERGVGLSAMQMDALGVGRGLVKLEFNGRTCSAKVWNAFGPDALRGNSAQIRITDSVAQILGCRVGDDVAFVEVMKANLRVAV